MASSLCASSAAAQMSSVLRVVRLQRLLAGQREAAFGGVVLRPSGIDGSRPPGKISVTMNLMKRGQLERQRHATLDHLRVSAAAVMVCSSMTPSSGNTP